MQYPELQAVIEKLGRLTLPESASTFRFLEVLDTNL